MGCGVAVGCGVTVGCGVAAGLGVAVEFGFVGPAGFSGADVVGGWVDGASRLLVNAATEVPSFVIVPAAPLAVTV